MAHGHQLRHLHRVGDTVVRSVLLDDIPLPHLSRGGGREPHRLYAGYRLLLRLRVRDALNDGARPLRHLDDASAAGALRVGQADTEEAAAERMAGDALLLHHRRHVAEQRTEDLSLRPLRERMAHLPTEVPLRLHSAAGGAHMGRGTHELRLHRMAARRDGKSCTREGESREGG